MAASQTVDLHLRACHSIAEVVESSSRVRLKVVAQIRSSAEKSSVRKLPQPEPNNPKLQNLESQQPESLNPEPQHPEIQKPREAQHSGE